MEPQILIETRACLQIVLIGAVSANVVILYVRTIPGDARQLAKERMGNKNKTETLKPLENVEPKSKYPMPLTILLAKRWFLFTFG